MNFEARLRRIEKEIQKREMKRSENEITIDYYKVFRDLHKIYGNGEPYVPPPPGLTHDIWIKHCKELLHKIYSRPLEKKA